MPAAHRLAAIRVRYSPNSFTDTRKPPMSSPSDGPQPQFAAILCDPGTDPDDVLRWAIGTLQSHGITSAASCIATARREWRGGG